MAEIVLLYDLGIVVLAATCMAFLARMFKQPFIPAYILAGILIGPFGMKLITNQNVISTLAELGIAFLLFAVGLELDLSKLSEVGLAASLSAVIPTLLLFNAGLLAGVYFGFGGLDPLYLGLIIAFSSTMIVVKLLSDKNEIDTIHGRIVLGVLLVQDFIAIVALSVFAGLDGFSFQIIIDSVVTGAGLFAIAIVVSRRVLPTLFRMVSRSEELLFLVALSLLSIFSAFSIVSGLSIAIGAFLAGLSIATFPYNIEIMVKIRSLRDFFSTIFFVSLGMEVLIDPAVLEAIIVPVLVFTFLVLVLKPLIIMFLTSGFGYGRRVSFLTALSLAQVSEFSLILVLQGLELGHVSQELFSVTTIIAMVTMSLTAYAIKFNKKMFDKVSDFLAVFDRISRGRKVLEHKVEAVKNHIVVAGCHRMGYKIVEFLREEGRTFLVVDHNPEIIKSLIRKGFPCIYGDIADVGILTRLHVKDASVVLSTIANEEDDMLLIEETKRLNPECAVFVTARSIDSALELYNMGADYVIMPKYLSGEKMVTMMRGFFSKTLDVHNLRREQILHLEKLEEEKLLDRYEPVYLKDMIAKFRVHKRRRKKEPKGA